MGTTSGAYKGIQQDRYIRKNILLRVKQIVMMLKKLCCEQKKYGGLIYIYEDVRKISCKAVIRADPSVSSKYNPPEFLCRRSIPDAQLSFDILGSVSPEHYLNHNRLQFAFIEN